MLFWHLGATVAVARYTFRDARMDLRFLAFGAIVPDLIDTPIGLVFWESFHSVRLWSHSLLASSVVMVAVLLRTRRGRPRRRWMAIAVGMLLHLFLDAMWDSQETLWWPFLGLDITEQAFSSVALYVGAVLSSPIVWAGEIVGAVYLFVLGRRGGLYGGEKRREFLRTGVIDVPIGES